MKTVEDKVRRVMEAYGLAEQGGHIVAGVSGGPDSLCLFHVLHHLAPGWGMSLSAVHVNHGIRGEAADRDQAFTESFCKELGRPCRGLAFNVPALAAEWRLGEEEAGRQLRYRVFEEERRRFLEEDPRRPVCVAVAQNLEDQAETVLMRILRGTGTDGLAGMEYIRDGWIVRPLLDVSRQEIEDYCREKGLAPCRDRTNEEVLYTRNRIRLELIPYLQENYNPNIVQALARLAAIAAQDKDCLYALARGVERERTEQGSAASLAALKELHPALRKRALLDAFRELGLIQDVAAVHLEEAEALIMEDREGELDFPGRYRLRRRGEKVFFLTPESREAEKAGDVPVSFAYPVPGRGTLELPEAGRSLTVCALEAEEWRRGLAAGGKADKNQVALDLSALEKQLGPPLVCRNRRPGDWIRPRGMEGSKKLQDLFVDKKVPRELRDRLPLLCRGAEVLWVPGCCAGGVGPGPETEKVLLLSLSAESHSG
ncbi:MAG: tRNA lysidine(34) synthetase TilS, partial [Bacillota bacterium]|nr:tRNA lysidine(34) synthetase TilS [Bacillota bacterium]